MKIILSRKMNIKKRGSLEEKYENLALSEANKYKKAMKRGNDLEKHVLKKARVIFIDNWEKNNAVLPDDEKRASKKGLALYRRKTFLVK